MAYKRNIDRLPIPPSDAQIHNVACHFCIVGCGYHALSWPVDRQGGMQPAQNAFHADLTKQQGAMATAWFSPSMYNIVKQNGRDVHLVVMPDPLCTVNSGLGSTRGAKIAELSYSTVTGTQGERLTEPLVWRYGVLTPTSWDDAIGLVAEVTRRVVETQGEDGLIVSSYDHGGAGGGYENTWATGKLYFESMKIKNIRIHNRPAYNSEVHGTRDMGVGELNNCYEDAGLSRHDCRRRHQCARDADQLLPQPLGAQSARHQPRQKEGRVRRRTGRAGQNHLRRSAPHADDCGLRGGSRDRTISCISRSTPAPISRSSMHCSPRSRQRDGSTRASSLRAPAITTTL